MNTEDLQEQLHDKHQDKRHRANVDENQYVPSQSTTKAIPSPYAKPVQKQKDLHLSDESELSSSMSEKLDNSNGSNSKNDKEEGEINVEEYGRNQHLEAYDEDADIPALPPHHKHRVSSSSASSGVFDLPEDSKDRSEPAANNQELDSDDDVYIRAPLAPIKSSECSVSKKQKAPKKKSRRQEVHELELTQQHPYLQNVLRDAIEHTIENFLFENAFPVYTSRAVFVRPILIAVIMKIDTPWAIDIRQRVESDIKFVEDLADLISACIGILRKDVKNQTKSLVAGIYSLSGRGVDAIKAHVLELLLQDHYIFATRPDSLKIIKKNLYLHAALMETMCEEWFTRQRSFSIKHLKEFASSHSDAEHSQPELPIAMVALAATAVDSFDTILYGWSSSVN
ncbi:hypothetical protein DXG01_001150 [Tephrocybe rancida]|nr:hypothetical protein DXG01_001150 [Tephrocybe rancida]